MIRGCLFPVKFANFLANSFLINMMKVYIEFHMILMLFKGFYLRKNEFFGFYTVKFDYNFANYVL